MLFIHAYHSYDENNISLDCLGDLVLLASGSAIPADSRVNDGEIEVDEAALTGESLPVAKFQGSNCLMGSTVVRGEVTTFSDILSHTFFECISTSIG